MIFVLHLVLSVLIYSQWGKVCVSIHFLYRLYPAQGRGLELSSCTRTRGGVRRGQTASLSRSQHRSIEDKQPCTLTLKIIHQNRCPQPFFLKLSPATCHEILMKHLQTLLTSSLQNDQSHYFIDKN